MLTQSGFQTNSMPQLWASCGIWQPSWASLPASGRLACCAGGPWPHPEGEASSRATVHTTGGLHESPSHSASNHLSSFCPCLGSQPETPATPWHNSKMAQQGLYGLTLRNRQPRKQWPWNAHDLFRACFSPSSSSIAVLSCRSQVGRACPILAACCPGKLCPHLLT